MMFLLLGTTTGIVIVIVIGKVLLAKIAGRRLDAGSVSDQWVAEHRAHTEG